MEKRVHFLFSDSISFGFLLKMDERLLQAAYTGNIKSLHYLLLEDPLILERVALASVPDTPLHIAVLAGKLEFAKEILRLKPNFASEMNKDGFSPIHLASANGNLEMVRELLKVDSAVCDLKDRDERTPLHLAAMKGRIEVLGELLSACPESAGKLTAQDETVLHLAVKYNQVRAFQFLLEKLPFRELLNAKDQKGNTVLHLAVSRKQTQTVELLLNSKFGSMIEVGAKNKKNLTAMDILDILLQSSCDVGDLLILQLLLHAQVVEPQKIDTVTKVSHNQIQSVNVTQNSVPLPAKCFWKEFFEEISRELDNSSSKARSALMVVAILIATVTFQAGINPPGGVLQDHSQEESKGPLTQTIHHDRKGAMIPNVSCYSLFLIFNTVGFLMSLVIISFLTTRFPLKPWLRLAVASMVTTYACAICLITSYRELKWARLLHTKYLVLGFFFGALASWKFWWLRKCVLIIKKRWNADLEEKPSSFIRRLRSFASSRSISHPSLTS